MKPMNLMKPLSMIVLASIAIPALADGDSDARAVQQSQWAQEFVCAVDRGRNDLAEALLKKGLDPNAPISDSGGTTLLYYAASQGDLSIVKTLLNANANPNIGPEDFYTQRDLIADPETDWPFERNLIARVTTSGHTTSISVDENSQYPGKHRVSVRTPDGREIRDLPLIGMADQTTSQIILDIFDGHEFAALTGSTYYRADGSELTRPRIVNTAVDAVNSAIKSVRLSAISNAKLNLKEGEPVPTDEEALDRIRVMGIMSRCMDDNKEVRDEISRNHSRIFAMTSRQRIQHLQTVIIPIKEAGGHEGLDAQSAAKNFAGEMASVSRRMVVYKLENRNTLTEVGNHEERFNNLSIPQSAGNGR